MPGFLLSLSFVILSLSLSAKSAPWRYSWCKTFRRVVEMAIMLSHFSAANLPTQCVPFIILTRLISVGTFRAKHLFKLQVGCPPLAHADTREVGYQYEHRPQYPQSSAEHAV